MTTRSDSSVVSSCSTSIDNELNLDSTNCNCNGNGLASKHHHHQDQPSSIHIDISAATSCTTSAGLCSVAPAGGTSADSDQDIAHIHISDKVNPSPLDSNRSEAGSSRSASPSPSSADLFRNLRNAQRFSIDIGGSLTKIAYYSKISHRRVKITTPAAATGSPNDENGTTTTEEFTYEACEGARLHFIKFETNLIEDCLEFIQKRLVGSVECMRGKCVKVTGGGAYKYCNLIKEKLGITPEKEDEIGCLIKGANFLLKNVANEAFSYERKRSPEYHFLPAGPVIYPYLLVNIGSGVSILKVTSEDEYERIGGTATGGGTFWGLGRLLTGAKGFDELLELAEQGEHRNVDMLVKDIYSCDYVQLGLPGDLIASSFGKATYTNGVTFSPADLARSLLFTIANDIGQIACLYALQYNLSRVYFGGYFLRNHPLSMSAVSYSIRFWSKEKVEALFLRHEGYLGAIGAFLRGTEELEPEKYSWLENFAGSSGSLNVFAASKTVTLSFSRPRFSSHASIEQLEIDRADELIGYFPLLSSSQEYIPDTVDLNVDTEARTYWLHCFEEWVEKITSRAIESQPNHQTSTDRALRCRHKLIARLNLLNRCPCAFGALTVRSLLDTFEQSLREFDFPDPYFHQKKRENRAAVGELNARLEYLDKLPVDELEEELIMGVLAGNVFDWGAKIVTNLLEGPDVFGFEQAMNNVQKRPWLVDYLDEWKERLKGEPHRCVAIFVDNSGFDFVLGIIPFVRQFLRRKTKVILCPNSDPAVNDITYPEMVSLLHSQIANVCPIIKQAITDEQLLVVSTGQGSPCLDLSRVSQNLINAVQEHKTDLVVIEGMGRSIHTNLKAKFAVEVLKLAVIKNAWLAEKLGGNKGELYSVVFSHESI